MAGAKPGGQEGAPSCAFAWHGCHAQRAPKALCHERSEFLFGWGSRPKGGGGLALPLLRRAFLRAWIRYRLDKISSEKAKR